MSMIARDRHFERVAVGLFSNPGRSRLYDENIERLKMALEYLTSLRDNEELTDKDYSALIRRTYAGFVENEMALAINDVLGEAVKDFKKTFEELNDEW